MHRDLKLECYFSEILERNYCPQAELNKLNEAKTNWTPIDGPNTYKYQKSNAIAEYFCKVLFSHFPK
jgi:hypothetical protein